MNKLLSKSHSIQIVYALVSWALLFSSCNLRPDIDFLPLPASQIPSKAAFASATPRVIITEPSTQTPFLVQSPISRATSVAPTWIPRPTLSPETAQALVLDLLSNNGGCQLPCWWGIMPGKTSWQEARNFLETLSPEIITFSSDFYWVAYKNLPLNVSDGAIGAGISIDENGVVQTISTDIYYPLIEMLQKHGKPDEIWIFADRQTINPEIPFTIALFYSGQGLLAVYEGTAAKEEKPQICPDRIGGDQLSWFLWDPSVKIPFAEAGRKVLLFVNEPSERPFLQLSDVSGIDEVTFYEMYVHPENSSKCFELLYDFGK